MSKKTQEADILGTLKFWAKGHSRMCMVPSCFIHFSVSNYEVYMIFVFPFVVLAIKHLTNLMESKLPGIE